jgi:hypothetical protein
MTRAYNKYFLRKTYVLNAGFRQRERDVEEDPDEHVGATDQPESDISIAAL